MSTTTTTGEFLPTIPNPVAQGRMTSLELADLTGKRHDHVMRDIKSLIEQGAINAPNFGAVEYKDAKGEMRPMYSLDFHATMVLITGYDANRRAMVIDRWVKLETGQALPSFTETKFNIPSLARDFRALKSIAKTAGLTGNQAVLSASQAAKKLYGHDPLTLIGTPQLTAGTQVRHFTPTELGMRHGGMSGIRFNLLLAEKCLQESFGEGKKKYWQPTELGKPHSVLVDTGKKHSDGSMVQQVRWFETVLDAVKEVAA